MSRISLLDCTLRDGGYLNDWKFGNNNIVSIFERLVASGVEFIEVGFIDQAREYDPDRSIYPDVKSINKTMGGLDSGNSQVVGMIDYGHLDISLVCPKEESCLDAIRVIFKKGIRKEAIAYCKQIKDLGYKVYLEILNSADYGIPQTRNRAYIVCFANENAVFQYPQKQKLKKFMPELLEKKVDEKYYLTNKIKKTILADGKGGYVAKSEINLKIARPLCATMAKMHRACQDNYVSESGLKIADIVNADNERIRRLTPRECARLQGFEDKFKIVVSDSQAYKQFGNAVTVNVAKAVAKSVKETLINLGEWE